MISLDKCQEFFPSNVIGEGRVMLASLHYSIIKK